MGIGAEVVGTEWWHLRKALTFVLYEWHRRGICNGGVKWGLCSGGVSGVCIVGCKRNLCSWTG